MQIRENNNTLPPPGEFVKWAKQIMDDPVEKEITRLELLQDARERVAAAHDGSILTGDVLHVLGIAIERQREHVDAVSRNPEVWA